MMSVSENDLGKGGKTPRWHNSQRSWHSSPTGELWKSSFHLPSSNSAIVSDGTTIGHKADWSDVGEGRFQSAQWVEENSESDGSSKMILWE